jgi:hypothetical protein
MRAAKIALGLLALNAHQSSFGGVHLVFVGIALFADALDLGFYGSSGFSLDGSGAAVTMPG